jgi:hypothetical protein
MHLSEEEWYPMYEIVPEDQATVTVDMPDDFILRYELLCKQMLEARRYIMAVRDGRALQ